ncbi:hypothetical protein ACFX13_043041 [Malus domestica]
MVKRLRKVGRAVRHHRNLSEETENLIHYSRHVTTAIINSFTFFYIFVLKPQRAQSELGDLSDGFLTVRRKQREANLEAYCRSQ